MTFVDTDVSPRSVLHGETALCVDQPPRQSSLFRKRKPRGRSRPEPWNYESPPPDSFANAAAAVSQVLQNSIAMIAEHPDLFPFIKSWSDLDAVAAELIGAPESQFEQAEQYVASLSPPSAAFVAAAHMIAEAAPSYNASAADAGGPLHESTSSNGETL